MDILKSISILALVSAISIAVLLPETGDPLLALIGGLVIFVSIAASVMSSDNRPGARRRAASK